MLGKERNAIFLKKIAKFDDGLGWYLVVLFEVFFEFDICVPVACHFPRSLAIEVGIATREFLQAVDDCGEVARVLPEVIEGGSDEEAFAQEVTKL